MLIRCVTLWSWAEHRIWACSPSLRLRTGADTLEQMGILHLADKPYTEISGGERQQVTIARAIVQQPQIILFDEPTAHLDFGNQVRIIKMIKYLSSQGFAILMTTHTPDHVIMLGDRVGILDRNGEMTFGNTEIFCGKISFPVFIIPI